MAAQPFEGASLLIAGEAPLSRQIREARAHYAESRRELDEAIRFYDQTIGEIGAFCELVPDELQRSLIRRRAIRDCAYWDAETSAAAIRLASLARHSVSLCIEE